MDRESQMPPRKRQPRVDLYVRSLCPSEGQYQQEQVIERLNELAEAGHIAGVSVHVWGKQIPRDGDTAVGGAIRDQIEAFEAWSDRTGTSLAQFFETRESRSLLTGETAQTIVLPTLCLAEVHGDEFQYVAPCVDDGTVCTVRDRLSVLEEGPTGDDWTRAHG